MRAVCNNSSEFSAGILRIIRVLIMGVGILLPSIFPVFAEDNPSETKPYLFGVVPQFNASRIMEVWQPILDTLAKETGLAFRLVGSDSIPEFEQEFSQGRFDFVYMNPYHFIHAERSQGYQPLVRDVGRMLYGILVVRKDSLLQSVEELDGKVVAFPAPNALGASLMPRAEFRNVYAIDVEPRYVKSHSSVYLNVALGKVDAGGGVQKTLEQQPENLKRKLRVIHQTQKVVSHPVAAHPRVPADDRQQVKNALLKLGQSEHGRALLSRVPVDVIGVASPEDYKPLMELGLELLYEN